MIHSERLLLCVPGLPLLGVNDGENVRKQHQFNFRRDQLRGAALQSKRASPLALEQEVRLFDVCT